MGRRQSFPLQVSNKRHIFYENSIITVSTATFIAPNAVYTRTTRVEELESVSGLACLIEWGHSVIRFLLLREMLRFSSSFPCEMNCLPFLVFPFHFGIAGKMGQRILLRPWKSLNLTKRSCSKVSWVSWAVRQMFWREPVHSAFESFPTEPWIFVPCGFFFSLVISGSTLSLSSRNFFHLELTPAPRVAWKITIFRLDIRTMPNSIATTIELTSHYGLNYFSRKKWNNARGDAGGEIASANYPASSSAV